MDLEKLKLEFIGNPDAGKEFAIWLINEFSDVSIDEAFDSFFNSIEKIKDENTNLQEQVDDLEIQLSSFTDKLDSLSTIIDDIKGLIEGY